ncbi:MAG: hypothetical protein LBD57_01350 [Endomicrobium sp.]|jgi:hypothetical protein|nr:hypothetical protein [Endomicrobium sp.]
MLELFTLFKMVTELEEHSMKSLRRTLDWPDETEEEAKGKLTEPKTIQILSKNLFVCF